MVWCWPALEGRDNCLPLVTAFRFLTAAVLSAAMGCFFSCFRLGGSDDPPSPDGSRYPLVSHPELEDEVRCKSITFSSLFISDEKEDQYGLEDGVEKQDIETPELELDVTGLEDQAKLLKACGTIHEAPVEIQKLSKECGDSAQKGISETPKFKSWFPNTSIENKDSVAQPDQPLTPYKNCEELMEGSVSCVLTPSSYMNDGEKSIGSDSFHGSVSMNTPFIEINANQTHSFTVSSVSPAVRPSTTRMCKSVHFDVESDSSKPAKKFSSNFTTLKPQLSPYPTPLKLTDEMQTPGTIFPAYVNNMANGKNPKVRYQYVFSTLNHVHNVSQMKELMDEGSISIPLPSDMGDYLEQPNETNLNSDMVLRETSAEKESKSEASLSSWLKSPLNQDDSNLHFSESVHIGRTPGERPILGMVAGHWYDQDEAHISPKWWNGNGIPNTTTKYKEDQKVNWHATPFEERLEKALSDETFVSRRAQISITPPISFNENEGLFAQ